MDIWNANVGMTVPDGLEFGLVGEDVGVSGFFFFWTCFCPK